MPTIAAADFFIGAANIKPSDANYSYALRKAGLGLTFDNISVCCLDKWMGIKS